MSGTMRALVANMVQGVKQGFEKRLTLVGVGYRAQAQGDKLNLTPGFLASGRARAARGRQGRDAHADRDRDQGHRQAGRSARSPPRFARTGRPSRTRARACAIPASRSCSKRPRRSKDESSDIGAIVGADSKLPLNSASRAIIGAHGKSSLNSSGRDLGHGKESIETAPRREDARAHRPPGGGAPHGASHQPAHLRPGDRRHGRQGARVRLDAGEGSARTRIRTAARRTPPPKWAAGIAEKAKAAGIDEVAFDRAGFSYHGRVKALAEAAREAGLKF